MAAATNGSSDTIACPLWRTASPDIWGVFRPREINPSKCMISKSKAFSRDGAHTVVTLHQTEEAAGPT